MIQLIGIPYDQNSSFLKGPALAPARIRLMDADGSSNAFAENGQEIVQGKTYGDLGDLSFADNEPGKAISRLKMPSQMRCVAATKSFVWGAIIPFHFRS